MSSVFSVPSGVRRNGWRGRTRIAGLVAAALVAAAVVPTALHLRSAGAAEYPGPGAVSGNVAVHDPSMVKGPDGTYLLAATAPGIALRTSTDRTKFTYTGLAFPNGTATWTDEYTGTSNGNLWAPDLSYQNGKYYLYYSASSFGKNKSAIFLATSTTGKPGSWTNQGKIYSTTTSSNHNAIDPNLVIDRSGKWYLSLGSFWTGIKMIELNPSTGKRISSSSTVYSIASRANSTAIEAPAIIYHAGYYYLFTSWDACCQGTSSTYKIMVGRSKTITGPYKDRPGNLLTAGGGTQILGTHGTIVGPGGQSLIQDGDGDVLVYHYYDGADNGVAKLGINRLTWDSSNWPAVS
ncbi:arabinan endo-1,5-alpha-L-arabinosidase [Kineosporia sp. NBRC 101731]|uniref:arabinan endo-1,5-alpha-L-arabinosidase n=1 Tax=Kineosporia sp. NBRC 101731 TaxID=3032199 RepID=UPI0024A03BF8|nr:arabinan endo-1,5-alpha-L-arabinosidase [Kineosporia sp. NBRC 101731]GLY33015.1 arabinan endo-1,5-alpha-L-arabinosidase [Kineosporia sp. NBRC 101731]